jgi:hypothetical protein
MGMQGLAAQGVEFGGEVVTSRYFHCKAVLSTLDQLGEPKTHTWNEETCNRHGRQYHDLVLLQLLTLHTPVRVNAGCGWGMGVMGGGKRLSDSVQRPFARATCVARELSITVGPQNAWPLEVSIVGAASMNFTTAA